MKRADCFLGVDESLKCHKGQNPLQLCDSAIGICDYALHRGPGIAQWLERRTRDRKVAGSSPGRSGEWIFLLRSQLPQNLMILISVSVQPPCYRSST